MGQIAPILPSEHEMSPKSYEVFSNYGVNFLTLNILNISLPNSKFSERIKGILFSGNPIFCF